MFLTKTEMAHLIGVPKNEFYRLVNAGILTRPSHQREGFYRSYYTNLKADLLKSQYENYKKAGRAKYTKKDGKLYNQQRRRDAALLCDHEVARLLKIEPDSLGYARQQGYIPQRTHRLEPYEKLYYSMAELPELKKGMVKWRAKADTRKRQPAPPGTRACTQCTREVIGDFATCERCRNKSAREQKRRIEKGKCNSCGNDATKGTKCESCRKIAAARTKLWHAKKRASGLCIRCGEQKVDNTYCQPCRENYRITYHDRHKKSKQTLCDKLHGKLL
jgi:hypothetical protein